MALFTGTLNGPPPREGGARPIGSVFLLGAGPGDPSLLTVKAARLLERADVVFYDALISDAILSLIPETTRKIAVGRRKGRVVCPQPRIHEELIRWARRGATVVRLKGGDPVVFGRAGEEVDALRAAGIRAEVLPGVTAASAAAAALCTSLTKRGCSSSFAFVSGHGAASYAEESRRVAELQEIAQTVETLAIYMGATRAARIARALLDAGRAPGERVAIVENASLPHERILRLTLAELAADTARAPVQRPALILIGPTIPAAEAEQSTVRLAHTNRTSTKTLAHESWMPAGARLDSGGN